MKYSKYGKTKGFFAGKGFYIVLAVCIAAIGLAAWSAVSTISTVEDSLNSSQQKKSVSSYRITSSAVQETEQKASDVEDTRSSSEAVTSEVPQSQPDTYILPVVGDISKNFSNTELQPSATYGDMRLHTGVDILADKDTPVVSAAAGTVIKVADDPLWGKMAVVDHENGIVCYYCGLGTVAVVENDKIVAGASIGTVGVVPCECADASHLHIAVTVNDEYVSPLDLMKMQ